MIQFKVHSVQLLTFVLLAAIMFVGATCKKASENPVTPQQETAVITISSTSGGTTSTPSGAGVTVIPGAVPPNQNGQSGSVAFSIEIPVDPPKVLPAWAALKGSVAKFGPDGFYFRWPIRITLPYPEGSDPSALHIAHYNASTDMWGLVPISGIDAVNRRLSADVLELGYYAVVSVSQGTGKRLAQDSEGGFEFEDPSGSYYYTLTVKSAQFKYSYQIPWYPDIIGSSGSTGQSSPGGGPATKTHIWLPQGSYEIWITRTQPGTLSTLPRIYTYTIPATGTISSPLHYWGMGNVDGWTPLSLPGGGEWREGSPQNWPAPTVTYGTGDFQATLTWVNRSDRHTDVDLHLYGPNNMHVYYGHKTSADSSFQLDRDWLHELGNAVENIYSLKPPSQWPKGEYTIKVNLFSGVDMPFNVRVKRGASVHTYSGTVTQSNSWITLEQFTIQ